MTKTQLEEITRRMLAAAPYIIVAARSHTLNRSCMICGVEQGVQHNEGCALWELVAARIDYHRRADSPTRSSEAAPDPIQTMAMLEQGGDFTPTAPASDEWWVA